MPVWPLEVSRHKKKRPADLPRAGKLYAERSPLEDPSLREGAHTAARTHAAAGVGRAAWIDGEPTIRAGKLHMHIYASYWVFCQPRRTYPPLRRQRSRRIVLAMNPRLCSLAIWCLLPTGLLAQSIPRAEYAARRDSLMAR